MTCREGTSSTTVLPMRVALAGVTWCKMLLAVFKRAVMDCTHMLLIGMQLNAVAESAIISAWPMAGIHLLYMTITTDCTARSGWHLKGAHTSRSLAACGSCAARLKMSRAASFLLSRSSRAQDSSQTCSVCSGRLKVTCAWQCDFGLLSPGSILACRHESDHLPAFSGGRMAGRLPLREASSTKQKMGAHLRSHLKHKPRAGELAVLLKKRRDACVKSEALAYCLQRRCV